MSSTKSVSITKCRRNFRNSKNNREHKLKQKTDELDSKESKLDILKLEFSSLLRKLTDYEELNIFSRDDDSGTISNILIENSILNEISNLYKSLINDEKKNYNKIQDLLLTISGDINVNLINLVNVSTDIDTFYNGINNEFLNEENFRDKINEKLNKLNNEIKYISPLIYGKNIESPLKIAILISNIYSSINLEKKQFEKAKQELKKHQHDTITMDGDGNDNNDNDEYLFDDFDDFKPNYYNNKGSKYKLTNIKEIESKINDLRRLKSEIMKKLIKKVYHNNYNKKYIKELKLKQVDLYYKDSIIEDNKLSLKLKYELLEIQCEEFQNQLILLEKKKEINEAKKQQLKSEMTPYLNYCHSITNNNDKLLSKEALNELKKLQKLEREQRNIINLTEIEIRKLDKFIHDEKQKQNLIKKHQLQKRRKMKQKKKLMQQKQTRQKSFDEEEEKEDDIDNDSDNEEKLEKLKALKAELESIENERTSLEDKWDKNNDLIEDKTHSLHDLQTNITESQEQKKELQKMIHHYDNSMDHIHRYTESTSRENSGALECIQDMNFLNEQYEIKYDQINNRYREKQTKLKNKFIEEYNMRLKREIKNRQTQIETEFMAKHKSKDDDWITKTQTINAETMDQQIRDRMNQQFDNKTKPVKIKFGKKLISSDSINNSNNNTYSNFDVLQPIKFIWNENNQHNKQENMINIDDDITDDDESGSEDNDEYIDITDELSTDSSYDDIQFLENQDLNYTNLVNEVINLIDNNLNNNNIYDIMNKQMDIDNKQEIAINEMKKLQINANIDIETDFIQFDTINPIKELLINWNINSGANIV